MKRAMGKNQYPLEEASYGKISQHLQLSKRGSKTGLVINAPAKFAANFYIKCIFCK